MDVNGIFFMFKGYLEIAAALYFSDMARFYLDLLGSSSVVFDLMKSIFCH